MQRYRYNKPKLTVILHLIYVSYLIFMLSYLLSAEMNTHLHMKSQKCFVPALAENEKHTCFLIMLGIEITTFQTGFNQIIMISRGC